MATLLHLCFLAAVLAGLVSASGTTTNSTAATWSCPRRYHCGDAVDIRYPFWVGDGNGTHCGYPSLRLECRGGTPVLHLPSGDYGITRILYGDTLAGNRTVNLFDLRVSMDSTCPHVAGRNLTLPAGSPPPLSLTSSDVNITFYTNCSFRGMSAQVVPCLETVDGWHHTYIFREDDFPMPPPYIKLCDGVVGLPVLRRPMAKNATTPLEGVMAALNGGFELRWRQATGGDCGACEKAGGSCGQRRDAQGSWAFTCLITKNGTESRELSGATSLRSTGAIAAIALLLAVLLTL